MTPDPATLRELLKRVEEASGRLSEEDLGRLICAVLGHRFDSTEVGCGDDGSDDFAVFSADIEFAVYGGHRHRMPDVSLDAALALMERVFPGAFYHISRFSDGQAAAHIYPNRGLGDDYAGDAATPALALIAALLRALLASAESSSHG